MSVSLFSARQPGTQANVYAAESHSVERAENSDATRKPSTTGTVFSSNFQTVVNRALVPKNAVAATPELNTHREIIYKSGLVTPPSGALTLNEREQRIEGYANRVLKKINTIEIGSEGERNINFLNVRLFMEPAGYFSGGLLAAGLDPHEKFTVRFDTYVGMGSSKTLSSSDKRTYFAWEIAAGALAHDKVAPGGALNFHDMTIEPKDRRRVKDLEAIGKSLQAHWENEISAPMSNRSWDNNLEAIGWSLNTDWDSQIIPQQGTTSMTLVKRSGKADAYVARGTLQSLRSDTQRFETLSPEGQEAVKRTLDRNGQVIIPNVYGFPLGGYAFIPYTPYDGNYEHRPNQGMMIDLKNGSLHEIHGDEDFAGWAKNNRDNLLRSFNARDRQGGLDTHWPKAQHVLDSLILGHTSHYPGYSSLLSDQAIPVRETFNFTRSRGGDYQLKYGDLNSGIASKYETLNASNALWSDQTEVFGSSQQNWKAAKDLWGSTFGYIPVLGNAGNIVFGVHDSLYGMTANDRIGGNSSAVISALQLTHELAPGGGEAGLGEHSPGAITTKNYRWNYNSQTRDFEFVRQPEPVLEQGSDTLLATGKDAVNVVPDPDPVATFPGMREVKYNGKTCFVADKPDGGDGVHYILRVQDPSDGSKLVSTGVIVKQDEAGVWSRRGVSGGNSTPLVRLKEQKEVHDQVAARANQIFELKVYDGEDLVYSVLDPKDPGDFIPHGAYVYVVRAEEPDKLYIGSVHKGLTPKEVPYHFNRFANPDYVEGHSALAKGLQSEKGGTTDVLFAGGIYFQDGKIVYWTNASGHYLPDAELRHTNLTPAIKNILPETLFVDETKISSKQLKQWTDDTTMTQKEMDERDQYVKNAHNLEDSRSDISDEEQYI